MQVEPRQEVIRDRGRTIGAILIEQGRLSPADVSEVQRYATLHGVRFGDAALRLGLLTQADIEQAIGQQFNYPILKRGGERGVSDEVLAGYQPQSEAVEELRALRSRIFSNWSAEKRVLAVTSAGRREGRSWLAANLAVVCAQLGKRTLLIDSDMRHPRQHRLFNLANAAGLSALLTGRAGREIVARIHPQLRLFVLPAGLLPPNPQELLGRQVFSFILETFSEQYDMIIMDTPAISETADAQIVAEQADGALVLAHRHHTRQADLAAAMGGLVQAGVNVIGSVITDH